MYQYQLFASHHLNNDINNNLTDTCDNYKISNLNQQIKLKINQFDLPKEKLNPQRDLSIKGKALPTNYNLILKPQ